MRVLWYWLLAMLVIVYTYSLKSIITSPRYLLFFAPIVSLVFGDMYRKKINKMSVLIVFSLFLCIYDTNIGYQYRGDNKAMIESI